MRSSWPSRFLLPAAQVLAEGSWLAVTYAALQALVGQPVRLGPLELAVLAWAGMAWGRRRRWTSPAAEALGLPLLALAAGLVGWIIDPEVRRLLVDGQAAAAIGLHVPGWIGAVAFWRGEIHRSTEDDDAIQDRLLRLAVPGLALPWAIGYLATDGVDELRFTAAAFVGTVFFFGSAFTAMGLARLEAVRAATGSDWRSNRSWIALVVGVALAVTVVAIPAAAYLGVPASNLLGAMLGPLQAIFFALVLLATPVILLAAAVAEIIGPMLPEGFGQGTIELPDFAVDATEVTSNIPVVVFYIVVGLVVAVELVILGVILWMRWQERRRMNLALADPFEERSIVIPPPEPSDERQSRAGPGRRRRRSSEDPIDAYLEALATLDRHGRWRRRPHESPAQHAARLELPAFARMASAYQLARYGLRELGGPERRRAPGRLRTVRRQARG